MAFDSGSEPQKHWVSHLVLCGSANSANLFILGCFAQHEMLAVETQKFGNGTYDSVYITYERCGLSNNDFKTAQYIGLT